MKINKLPGLDLSNFKAYKIKSLNQLEKEYGNSTNVKFSIDKNYPLIEFSNLKCTEGSKLIKRDVINRNMIDSLGEVILLTKLSKGYYMDEYGFNWYDEWIDKGSNSFLEEENFLV